MGNIKKIALTGGPCAGKTTSIERIKAEFCEKDYNVLVVPEAATLLINMGIRPFGNNAVSMLEFQKYVLETQEILEEFATRNAKQSNNDTIIICDRGFLDSKAYITETEFKELLSIYDKKELDYMHSYDLVIHLRTAAYGKEEFYTLDNNGARTETPDEARMKDTLTLNSWLGHPKLVIVGNDTNFEEKQNRVLSEIYNILGKPYPIQRQYKYLVDSIHLNNFDKTAGVVRLDIEQYILTQDEKEEVTYRRTVKDNETYYKAKIKRDTDIENERIATERSITDREYYLNMPKDKTPIRKIRYCFEYNNQYFSIDFFEDGLCILEVEHTNKNYITQIPDFITISEDITLNTEYRNSSIYNRINKKDKSLENKKADN